MKMLLILSCTLKNWKSFLMPITHSLSNLVVEDDEDDFPTMRSDGDFLHNSNSSKEKCKCLSAFHDSLSYSQFIQILMQACQAGISYYVSKAVFTAKFC